MSKKNICLYMYIQVHVFMFVYTYKHQFHLRSVSQAGNPYHQFSQWHSIKCQIQKQTKHFVFVSAWLSAYHLSCQNVLLDHNLRFAWYFLFAILSWFQQDMWQSVGMSWFLCDLVLLLHWKIHMLVMKESLKRSSL